MNNIPKLFIPEYPLKFTYETISSLIESKCSWAGSMEFYQTICKDVDAEVDILTLIQKCVNELRSNVVFPEGLSVTFEYFLMQAEDDDQIKLLLSDFLVPDILIQLQICFRNATTPLEYTLQALSDTLPDSNRISVSYSNFYRNFKNYFNARMKWMFGVESLENTKTSIIHTHYPRLVAFFIQNARSAPFTSNEAIRKSLSRHIAYLKNWNSLGESVVTCTPSNCMYLLWASYSCYAPNVFSRNNWLEILRLVWNLEYSDKLWAYPDIKYYGALCAITDCFIKDIVLILLGAFLKKYGIHTDKALSIIEQETNLRSKHLLIGL